MDSTEEIYKTLDQIISGLLKHLAFLQYYPPEAVSLRGVLIFTSLTFITLQPVVEIYKNFHKWNFLFQVASIDTLIISLGILMLSIDIFLASERFRTLVNLSKSRYELKIISHSNPNILREKVDLVKSITSDQIKLARRIIAVISLYSVSLIVLPLSDLFLHLLQIKTVKNTPRPLSLSSSFTCPSFIPRLVFEFMKASLELFFIYYTTMIVCNLHTFQSITISNIIGDIKLFHFNLREVDEYFKETLESGKYKSATGTARRRIDRKLRSATRDLVIQHQRIFRNVQLLNYGSEFRVFYSNSYICLQIVFALTMILKCEFLLRVKYGLMFIGFTLFEFVYNESGQLLEDEGERMRVTLYNSNWMEKPTWFTKALQIMMIRSNKLPSVGVLNFFTLNRKNKTEVMRGAYGYFNFLNEFST